MKKYEYYTSDFEIKIQRQDLPLEDNHTQLDVMRTWFFQNFEDPAECTPFDSGEGGYQYIWGGPYDAQEELTSEFYDIVPYELIVKLSDELNDICCEWAPIDIPDDYEEYYTDRSPSGNIMTVEVQEINGYWEAGYVLDNHMKESEFLGNYENGRPKFNNIRTEVGESIFQLKYRGDQTQIPLLAKVFVSNLKSRLKSVDLIIPMPPSKPRSFQPIVELAKVIANKMELLFFDDILVKSKSTVQMKDNSEDLDRIDILKNSFLISDEIEGDGPWDALILDDVYSTGSSLNAAAMTLQTYQKIRNIYVAAFSRTKKS